MDYNELIHGETYSQDDSYTTANHIHPLIRVSEAMMAAQMQHL
jgi:hypothetical protein